ncbi:MAG: hypothetical protein DSZ06_03185 [Sulfurospirillum sp.]|nr:MAG: hypothetical protein DSZ06_03185 [Sulfurospirillum sp.]
MRYITFAMIITVFLSGVARSDTLEDGINDIAVDAQKLANSYLRYYSSKNSAGAKENLTFIISSMENNFRELARQSRDENIKNMLEYLIYSKDNIKNIISKNISKENTKEVLDICKTIIEGTISFYSQNEQNSSIKPSNKLNLEFLTNSYLLQGSNINVEDKKIKNSTKVLSENLNQSLQFNKNWRSYKEILTNKEIFVPNIIMILTRELEEGL